MDSPPLTADPITWLTDDPVWVDQWPLTKEKLEAAEQLVLEQLGHLEISSSPWNTPIFIIKKKSGKYRLLQDLRAVHKTMLIMGALQPGLPSPTAIPHNYHLLVIDLKDCFFTIPLFPEDRKHFAFSLPSLNFKEAMRRFQWKVLPQGMANSPTLCQKYVAQALTPVRKRFPSLYLIHYMDDILLATDTISLLETAFQFLQQSLQSFGLVIASKKIQRQSPFLYLGKYIDNTTIRPQKLQIRVDNLKTLNDFQKLLGDINWLRPSLKLTTAQLQPLFDILKGDSDPSSSRSVTPEGFQALQIVNRSISSTQLTRTHTHLPIFLIICPTPHVPTAVLWQTVGIIE